MELSGVHFLLTYQCTFECDHCFVFGSPFQSGTFTLKKVREVLHQAKEMGTVEQVYFEGGEPFLYYALMRRCLQESVAMGFKAGIVTNGYWATDLEDAMEWLRPLVGLIEDLPVSSDLYHYDELISQQARYAADAAGQLGITVGYMSVAAPEQTTEIDDDHVGTLPTGLSGVMYRGRAAEKLAGRAPQQPWEQFTSCPYEDLREPGRIHLDPLGHVHICQGISLGNVFETSLGEICTRYDPDDHPITGPLLRGGPVELVRQYDLPHEAQYADACHLCYTARLALRERFPEILTPDQMYGIM